jgi:hypothetical protein
MIYWWKLNIMPGVPIGSLLNISPSQPFTGSENFTRQPLNEVFWRDLVLHCQLLPERTLSQARHPVELH